MQPIKLLQSVLLISLLIAITSCNGQTKKAAAVNTTAKQELKTDSEPKISLPQGVSQQTMFRCSIKDNNGNLWFGTTGAGIYKYDGKLFIRYAEVQGLSNTVVNGIAQGNNGVIWVATDDGIFYSKANGFKLLTIPGFAGAGNMAFGAATKKLLAYCIISDKKGDIWFGTDNQGLWKYDGNFFMNFKCNDSVWAPVSSNNNQQHGFVSAIVEDGKGNIWISSSGSRLSYYDGKLFHNFNGAHSRHHVLQMITDRNGNIWMATRLDGLCRFNGKTIESFTAKNGIPDDMASSVYEDRNGMIWVGSLGKATTGGEGVKGVTKYDGKSFTVIPSIGLRNSQVWTITGDNAGNIWVGTKEFGLYRYDGKSYTEFTTR